MLQQAFWVGAISRTQTCEWYRCFKESQTSVEDKWAFRATFSIKKEGNIQQVRKMIHSSRRLTVREVAKGDGI